MNKDVKILLLFNVNLFLLRESKQGGLQKNPRDSNALTARLFWNEYMINIV